MSRGAADGLDAPFLKVGAADAANLGDARAVSIPRRSFFAARSAYDSRDAEASRAAHALCAERRGGPHVEEHSAGSSEGLKAFVFGGLDGIVTVFAIVAGCAGAQVSPAQLAVVGVGNLLADGFSMGFGEYVGAQAEDEFQATEKSREAWELRNFPEGEKQEMYEIYRGKYGFTAEDAEQMVELAFKYQRFFLNHMMAEELGMIVDSDGPTPGKRGLIMLASFVLFGSVPLLAYLAYAHLAVRVIPAAPPGAAFAAAAVASAVTLFALGAIKAKFVHQTPLKSGAQMLANGVLSGTIAYFAGKILPFLAGAADFGPLE